MFKRIKNWVFIANYRNVCKFCANEKTNYLKCSVSSWFCCDLDRIQTCNLLSRNQVRYSVAPRGQNRLQIYRYSSK